MADRKRWFNEQPVAPDTDAQADMIERLRTALDAMLDGKTPEEMANFIDDNLSDPLFDSLPRGAQMSIIRRRNALRALQPGDRGTWE